MLQFGLRVLDSGEAMSTRRKGQRIELKAMKELEVEGYMVEKARPDLRWIGPGRCISKAHDILETFDLLAVRKDGIRFIQVTVPAHASERRHKIEAIKDKFPYSVSLELWIYREGRAKKGDRLPRGFVKEVILPLGASVRFS